jgi:outer membrane protein TolC
MRRFSGTVAAAVPLAAVLWCAGKASAGTAMVTLNRFIESSCRHDTAFQEILIDELRLRYSEVLALPSQDWILTMGGEYGVTLGGGLEPEAQVSLDKLFPLRGSAFQAGASSTGSRSYGRVNELSAVYSVDVLRNAFGRSQRMRAHIAGIESRVARYQILQAYESYLAALVQAYYAWIKAHDEFLAAQASLGESNRLLESIRKKKARHIAYQIDVDKAHLQVVDKEERVRQTGEAFAAATMRAAYSMGEPLDAALIPDTTTGYLRFTAGAEGDLEELAFDSTRTGRIYAELYRRDSLSIARAVDDLLPALSVYAGVGLSDEGGVFADNARISAGVSMSLPFKKSRETALVEVARIDRQQTMLRGRSVRGTMTMRFAQLRSAIASQKRAVSLAEQRLELAKSILAAEEEDYLYGRTSLNYLIQALNTLQSNRLLIVNSRLELARMRLDALDLLDRLVTETSVDALRKKTGVR